MELVIIVAMFGSIGFVGIVDFIERKLKRRKAANLRVEECNSAVGKKAC